MACKNIKSFTQICMNIEKLLKSLQLCLWVVAELHMILILITYYKVQLIMYRQEITSD